MDENETTLPSIEVEEVFATFSQITDWGLRQLNVPETWKVTDGEGMTAMVIDTGHPVHPDIDDNARRGENFIDGEPIEDENGTTIGKHKGFTQYTIGQRKGIRIARKEPFYVVNIDALKNTITVGGMDDLLVKKIFVNNLNLLNSFEKNKNNCYVKVRSTGKLIKANIKLNENSAEINLEENEKGVSPGQACVFYSKNDLGDKVLGGGWIVKADNKYLST